MTDAVQKKTMEGKTVVVTGSTSGIGEAIAKEMLNRGAKVMIHGYWVDKVVDGKVVKSAAEQQAEYEATTLAQLKETYGADHIGFHVSDIGKWKATKELMKKTAELGGGKIDALVNNAGVQIQKPIEKLSPKEFDLVIKTNMYGPFFASKAALPYLKRERGQGFSQVINISSVHGLVPSPERVAYCMAKHGDEALKGVAAAEWAQYGIRVNNINPAFVKTDLARGPINQKTAEFEATGMDHEEATAQALSWRLQNQKGEWISLDAVAKAAADLADFSDTRASGQSVLLDNGYVKKALDAGAAFFEKAAKVLFDGFNQQIAALAKSL